MCSLGLKEICGETISTELPLANEVVWQYPVLDFTGEATWPERRTRTYLSIHISSND